MSTTHRRLIALAVLCLPVFAGSAPGIDNFDQVDAHVYRGAQPSNAGFQYLAKLGVKTVIDLQEAGGRAMNEQQVVTSSGMKYINVPMTGLTPPTNEETDRILSILEDAGQGPVFVHCHRGADRTGAVIAAYRIDFHKWDNGRALAEAKAHKMGRFQIPRQNFIKSFRPRSVAAASAAPADPKAVTVPAVALPAAAAGSKN